MDSTARVEPSKKKFHKACPLWYSSHLHSKVCLNLHLAADTHTFPPLLRVVRLLLQGNLICRTIDNINRYLLAERYYVAAVQWNPIRLILEHSKSSPPPPLYDIYTHRRVLSFMWDSGWLPRHALWIRTPTAWCLWHVFRGGTLLNEENLPILATRFIRKFALFE